MLFPDPFPNLLTPDLGLAGALAAAQAETAVSFPAAGVHLNAAISVVAITDSTSGPPTFRHAGFRDREMHFSGSLLKVAAMLAAFELRQSASDFTLTTGDCAPGVVFSGLSGTFDRDIHASVPRFLRERDIKDHPEMRVPKYATIFGPPQGLASGGCLMSFNPVFATNLEGMIVPSNNAQAAACIKALGYSWINGMLSKVALFDQATNRGIWLAGTFAPGTGFPAIRVPSVNDGPSAQATTCFDMARLYALLVEGNTLDSRSSDSISVEMLDLLAAAQSGLDASFLTTGRRQGVDGLGAGFTITHTKIGLGPLNAGGEVASEATILRHDASGRRFIVVWQNLLNLIDRHNAMSFMVRRTIENFIAIP
jgi:hypothetical protein